MRKSVVFCLVFGKGNGNLYMANKQGAVVPRIDLLKWMVAFFFLVLGIGSYYYFEISLMVRVVVLLLDAILVILLAASTSKGRIIWAFAQESRNEIRKVIWPTRQETVQSTLMVLAMVLVMAIILWAADAVLLRLIAWVTGHSGV